MNWHGGGGDRAIMSLFPSTPTMGACSQDTIPWYKNTSEGVFDKAPFVKLRLCINNFKKTYIMKQIWTKSP